MGTVDVDPKKVAAITLWPRPSWQEDIEKFLATTVFLRPHLSPRYSEVTKPLRDALKDLHARRAAGLAKKGPRKQPPSAPLSEDQSTWPEWWNPDCEEAFKLTKQMVTDAVALAVPGTVGAENGTNPYHLWPDACKYSIGSGLFQGSGVNV